MRPRLLAVVLVAILLSLAPAAHALKSDAKQPINIRANQIEANEKTGVSIYRGNVVLTQGTLRIEADRLQVNTQDGRTEQIRAWGKPVRMQNKSDKGEQLRARAAEVLYRVSARRIDLTGSVELMREDDVFTGAVVHYALDDQTFSAQGDGEQISVVIQPSKDEAAQ